MGYPTKETCILLPDERRRSTLFKRPNQQQTVFISYSRKDLAFVDGLAAALDAKGFAPTIDRAEIYAFEDWWRRIQSLILAADTVIFVLSPDAVASEICRKEVAFAQSLNKRFAPIVCRDLGSDLRNVPPALADLNFIVFDEAAAFDATFARLVEALETDIGWIREHTRYGQDAKAWADTGRPSGLLLRSPRLDEAERWIASRPKAAPTPTEETTSFILDSRAGANKRRRRLTGGLAIGFVLAVALALSALWQRSVAVQQEASARSQRETALVSKSRLLANRAVTANADDDFQRGILLSLEALRGPDDGGPKTYDLEAEKSLLDALYRNPLRGILRAKNGKYVSAGFVADTGKIVAVDDKGSVVLWRLGPGAQVIDKTALDMGGSPIIKVFPNPKRPIVVFLRKDLTYLAWDVEHRRPAGLVTGACTGERQQPRFDFDRNGKRLFVHCPDVNVGDAPASAEAGVTVFDFDTGKVVRTPGRFSTFAASADGTRFILGGDAGVTVVDSADGRRLTQWSGFAIRLQIAHDGSKAFAIEGYYAVSVKDMSTGKTITENAFGGQARSMEILASPKQDLLVIEGDDAQWVWRTGEKPAPVQTLKATPVRFLSDGALVTADGKKIAIVDYRIEGHTGTTYSVDRAVFQLDAGHDLAAVSNDTRTVLSLAKTGDLYVWSSEPAMLLGAVAADVGERLGQPLATSADGARIATKGETGIAIWDAETFKPIHQIRPLSATLTGLELSANGRYIAYVGAEGDYDVIDLSTKRSLLVEALPETSRAVGFSPDGRSIAIATDDDLSVWALATMSRSKPCALDKSAAPVSSLVWTDGDEIAYATSGGEVVVLTPQTCARKRAFAFADDQDLATTLRSKGDLVMALNGYRLQGWNLKSSRPTMDVSKADWDIFDISMAADTVFDIIRGRRFLTGRQSSQNIGIYDPERKAELLSFPIDKSECCGPAGVSVSARGDRLATLYHDRGAYRLRTWRLLPTIEDAIAYATKNVPECFSPEDRRQLGLDASPPAWCIRLRKPPYDTDQWRAKLSGGEMGSRTN